LPAEVLVPGQLPAQEAKWPTLGKIDMSMPHSAISTCPMRSPTPGIVQISSTSSASGSVSWAMR
jgi:hypothetical protein